MNKGIPFTSVKISTRANLGMRPGDTVRVWQKIEEKGKTRSQLFEGLVLACKHGISPDATFTVRRVASGIGVEKIFPLYSPVIEKIEIARRAKVRRAKLYYVRDKVAREIKRQMRRMRVAPRVGDKEERGEDSAEESIGSVAVTDGTGEA